MESLPGAELVKVGLADLRAGQATKEALLVSLAATRLRGLGVAVTDPIPDADHKLWELLAAEDSDSAHNRFNALVERLVSFERALACAS